MPAALALGVPAGRTNFVPYIGAIVSGVPSIVLAFKITEAALCTIGLYIAIHVPEGYVLAR